MDIIIDGKKCGIPWEYWEHKVTVTVTFGEQPLNLRVVGKVREIINGEEVPGTNSGCGRDLEYGSSITVKAIPYEGYRFVRWSDGVTTQIREEKNIISYIEVYAVFEKIE